VNAFGLKRLFMLAKALQAEKVSQPGEVSLICGHFG
jgi:hypothetical protein